MLYQHVERSFNLWGDLTDHVLLKVNFLLQVISAFHATHYSNIFLMFLWKLNTMQCALSIIQLSEAALLSVHSTYLFRTRGTSDSYDFSNSLANGSVAFLFTIVGLIIQILLATTLIDFEIKDWNSM